MKVVEVVWEDSASRPLGWKPIEEYRGGFTKKTLECRSVGYLIEETKRRLILALSYDEFHGHVSSAVVIPRSAVRKMRRLR